MIIMYERCGKKKSAGSFEEYKYILFSKAD